jgi:hypothetical protein
MAVKVIHQHKCIFLQIELSTKMKHTKIYFWAGWRLLGRLAAARQAGGCWAGWRLLDRLAAGCG